MLVWVVLIKYFCSTTKVSFSNHKDELDAAKLKDFDFDTNKFNIWLERKRRDVNIRDGGCSYRECIRHMFKTCIMAINKDLVDSIKKER